MLASWNMGGVLGIPRYPQDRCRYPEDTVSQGTGGYPEDTWYPPPRLQALLGRAAVRIVEDDPAFNSHRHRRSATNPLYRRGHRCGHCTVVLQGRLHTSRVKRANASAAPCHPPAA